MHNSLIRRISALFVVAGLAVALTACSSSGSKAKADSRSGGGITIAGFKFTASSVKAGSAVTVTNNDNVTHTVTSDDGSSFDMQIASGKSASFTAPAAGTYKFHCKIHSTMHGSLTVT